MWYGVRFAGVPTTAIATDQRSLQFLPRAKLPTYHRVVCVDNFFQNHPQALTYKENKAANVFGVTLLDDNGLRTAADRYVELMLKAARSLLSNPRGPEGEFPIKAFYEAALRHLNALAAQISDVRAFNEDLFKKKGFTLWQETTVRLTKTATPTPLQMFCNAMRLFKAGDGSRGTVLASHMLGRQKRA